MLIGSRAISFWDKDFRVNPDSDWDIIGYPHDESLFRSVFSIPSDGKIEWHNPDHLNNQEILDKNEYEKIASPLTLAILYRSHLWRDYNWDAHIAKYHKYVYPMLYREEKILLVTSEILEERIKLTKKAYPQGNPKLMQSNEDFFDDNVKKVYDHDFLHSLYAYEDRPMFERLKKSENFESAWCEKDLWLQLTPLQRSQCVVEETYVIATERFMVPNGWNFNPKRGYYMALRKVCTTLTSGWFRDYAIDNFPGIYGMFDENKMNEVKNRLESGPVIGYSKQGV